MNHFHYDEDTVVIVLTKKEIEVLEAIHRIINDKDGNDSFANNFSKEFWSMLYSMSHPNINHRLVCKYRKNDVVVDGSSIKIVSR